MKTSTKLTLSLATILTLGSRAVQAENLIQNGSFEDYSISKNHGVWKEVTFNHWIGAGESWNAGIGKKATNGVHKIELDVGREVNELSQIVTTVEGTKYKLSLDAYARRNRTSDFQVLVDDEVVATFNPNRKWSEYNVYFTGTGSEQVISLKELDAQSNGLGTIIDNVRLEASNEMIKNGSFEHFTVNRNHGRWKEVTFDAWEGKGEAWKKGLGKDATNGAYKIELDVGREMNVLSQTVSTENRVEYELSLDAYARVANSSDFEIWVDDVKVKSITPSKKWAKYVVKFFGNGTAQKISLREVNSQSNGLGTVIDNVSLKPTGKFDNRPPLIEGVAKKSVSAYNLFVFTPNTSDVDGDTLTFSIENKPEWAEFNTTTGTLSGVPTAVGINSNIKISVTDGKLSTALAPFSLEVTEPIDIAQRFAKATQPPKDGYYWYSSPDKMIDGDDSTFNHTEGVATKNWVQLELPNPTKIHKIMVQSRVTAAYRLNGAKVYISDTPYNGKLDERQSVGTLLGNAKKQYIELSKPISGTYLIIKGKNAQNLHIATLEVYGEMPNAPKFTKNDYNITTSRWMNKIEAITNVKAIDYQGDAIHYSIENNVPFKIDDNGDIRVTGTLPNDSYSLNVIATDGIFSTTQNITINIDNKTTVDKITRSNSRTPKLSGLLPNNYNKGDEVTITVNGVSYNATVTDDMKWNITIDSPLPTGKYDVQLTINGNKAIVYEEYFEIYNSMMQKSTQSLSMTTIDNIDVNILSHTEKPLKKDEAIRGSSVWLKSENGKLILENKSYREIKSLLGEYTDENGKNVLVKLNFNQDILPYSTNILNNFKNATNIHIVHTAGHFDMKLSFGGKDCNADTPTDKTIYCTPTTRNDEVYSEYSAQNNTDLSEQQVYSIAMATFNHLYNSVNGLKTMNAWVKGEKYKGLDFSPDTYQSSKGYMEFVEDRDAYLYEHYFKVTMPNNHIKYSAMRYKYAAEGMGGGRSGNILGTNNGGSFASIWEGSIRYTNNRAYTYDTAHHEGMHAIGFNHASGMTYGWSHAIENIVKKFYTVGENPIVNVPKYVFQTKVISKNQIQLTVYKTSDATEDELNFEILSGTAVMNGDYSIESSDNDEANQVTLTMNNDLFTRFFIRVYGADSDELMSKMITPSDMIQTYIATDTNTSKEYHAISHANWKKGAKALNLPVKTNESVPMCKLFLGTDANIAYQVDADRLNDNYRAEIDGANWLESKNLMGRVKTWYQYKNYNYSDGSYTKTRNYYNAVVNDDTLGILCVKPIK